MKPSLTIAGFGFFLNLVVGALGCAESVERIYYIPRTRWGSIMGQRELGCAVKEKEDFVTFTLQEKPYLLEVTYWKKDLGATFGSRQPYYRPHPFDYIVLESQILTEVEAKWKEFFVTAIDITIKRKSKFRNIPELMMDVYATPFNDGLGHYRSKYIIDDKSGSTKVVETLVCRSIANKIDNDKKEKLIESAIYNNSQPVFDEKKNVPPSDVWKDPRLENTSGSFEGYSRPPPKQPH
jgi:hypothetical protein